MLNEKIFPLLFKFKKDKGEIPTENVIITTKNGDELIKEVHRSMINLKTFEKINDYVKNLHDKIQVLSIKSEIFDKILEMRISEIDCPQTYDLKGYNGDKCTKMEYKEECLSCWKDAIEHKTNKINKDLNNDDNKPTSETTQPQNLTTETIDTNKEYSFFEMIEFLMDNPTWQSHVDEYCIYVVDNKHGVKTLKWKEWDTLEINSNTISNKYKFIPPKEKKLKEFSFGEVVEIVNKTDIKIKPLMKDMNWEYSTLSEWLIRFGKVVKDTNMLDGIIACFSSKWYIEGEYEEE